MSGEPYPYIRPEDHTAFGRIINGDYPATYEEVVEIYKREEKAAFSHGQHLIPITVLPDEFEEYCRQSFAPGAEIPPQALLRFAIKTYRDGQLPNRTVHESDDL